MSVVTKIFGNYAGSKIQGFRVGKRPAVNPVIAELSDNSYLFKAISTAF
jgi:hypothetical protein